MSFDLILEKIGGKVHPTQHPDLVRAGRGTCPVCGGRKDKLSLGEKTNGAILLYCFSLCPPAEIVEALGMELSDLFPPGAGRTTSKHRSKGVKGWDWWSLVAALNHLHSELRKGFVELSDLSPATCPARLVVARLAGEIGELADQIEAGKGGVK